jgi:hypothetical protein
MKGDSIEDLYKLLRKYHKKFDIGFDEYKTNAEEIIEAIKCLEPITKNKWSGYRLNSIADTLFNYNKRMHEIIEYLKADKPFLQEYYITELKDIKDKIEVVKKLRNKGFTTTIMIGFGDNDGDISGGNVGNTMDYEGRYLNIREDDFVIMTDQNR